MKRIGIIGALDDEIGYYREKMSDRKKQHFHGFDFYTGELAGKRVVVVKSGAGKVNAALCAQVLISEFEPVAIIFTGVAGALNSSLGIGDIVISKDSLQHDIDATKLGFELGQIPFTKMRFFEAAPELNELAYSAAGELGLKAIRGRILSGDVFVTDERLANELRNRFEGDCIDMESAAVAQACIINGIPHVIIRSISDRADHSANVDFPRFCRQTAENSFRLVNSMLSKIVADNEMDIKSRIRTVPHWPKEGVMFRDITTLLKDKDGFGRLLDICTERYVSSGIDVVVGIEARGFIIGAALADRLGVGFVPIRKSGKLPSKTVSMEYELEYGKDRIEMHTDALGKGSRVLLVDDLIATGGTALAACKLVEKVGGRIAECCFVINLPDLEGRKKLEAAGYKVFCLVDFEGE
jgi:adenine phosphoribosyltransferase